MQDVTATSDAFAATHDLAQKPFGRVDMNPRSLPTHLHFSIAHLSCRLYTSQLLQVRLSYRMVRLSLGAELTAVGIALPSKSSCVA